MSRPLPATAAQPAELLPLLYFGFAHASLGAAFLLAGLWPQAVAGFFYHSWLVALVHLVTLGWITFSILGAIFIVGPLALRMEMPARAADYVAFGAAAAGLIGMAGHFWIEQYSGMAWSAGSTAIAVSYMTMRIAANVRHARAHPAVKLHIVLACANFWIAASMGLLLGIDKVVHFLPGYVLSNVFAHAHLAAIGWATMMVVGVAYRLLPMNFPSKIPSGRAMYASAVLLECGVLGLFGSLLMRSAWAPIFAVSIAAGLAVFAGHVVWMRRQLVSRPPGAGGVQFGLLHAAGAAVSLVGATTIGLVLVVVPASPASLHAAAAYGVLGLVGFLAQMVVAMQGRLLPMAAWLWAYGRSGFKVPPPSPHAMRDRALQAIVFAAWTVGVPSLALGMALESAALVGVGAWSLFAGVAIAFVDNAVVVSHALRVRRGGRIAA
jgi:hypothetical protein